MPVFTDCRTRGYGMAPLKLVEMESQTESMIVEFSDFWGMYPRRVAKKDARKAWDKITPKLHNQILTALFEWSRIWKDRGEIEYIPYPASWLNGERWEDEYPPHHRPYTARQHVQEQSKPTDEKERKLIPSHVLAALKKIRESA